VAQVLLTYVDRVPSAVAGRLNGSDFALCLPVGGMALETAESLRDTLAALPAMRATGAGAVVGGVDALPSVRSSAALAQADAALARAEAGEGEGVAVEHHGQLVADAAGASAWRIQIADALAQGRATLDESPVSGADGQVLHRACSLRLQLDEGGAFQPGRAWMALARRGQLLHQVELLTLHLALLASAKDANPRAVRVAAESLLVPGFVTEVQALLQTAAPSVRYLAIEIAETERLGDLRALVVAVTAWRSRGVRLGVAHAHASPLALPALQSMGIRFVTVGAQHLRGVAHDPALRTYAEGLFGLIRSLGLIALTDRVPAAADLELLWTLGLDGAALDPPPTRSDALPSTAVQTTSPACSV
jgi:EAL domain-containing protein (putative c-di-GMP-specific phosphodiesterase class I)